MENTKALEVANGHPAIIEAKELGYTYDEPYPTITNMCRDIRNLRAQLAECSSQLKLEGRLAAKIERLLVERDAQLAEAQAQLAAARADQHAKTWAMAINKAGEIAWHSDNLFTESQVRSVITILPCPPLEMGE